jgi:hypothetical protein
VHDVERAPASRPRRKEIRAGGEEAVALAEASRGAGTLAATDGALTETGRVVEVLDGPLDFPEGFTVLGCTTGAAAGPISTEAWITGPVRPSWPVVTPCSTFT